eukprot:Sdes_comp14946_c1_seq1m3662
MWENWASQHLDWTRFSHLSSYFLACVQLVGVELRQSWPIAMLKSFWKLMQLNISEFSLRSLLYRMLFSVTCQSLSDIYSRFSSNPHLCADQDLIFLQINPFLILCSFPEEAFSDPVFSASSSKPTQVLPSFFPAHLSPWILDSASLRSWIVSLAIKGLNSPLFFSQPKFMCGFLLSRFPPRFSLQSTLHFVQESIAQQDFHRCKYLLHSLNQAAMVHKYADFFRDTLISPNFLVDLLLQTFFSALEPIQFDASAPSSHVSSIHHLSPEEP